MWAAARICQITLKPAFKSTVPVLKNTITANSVCFVDAGCAVRHQALRKFTNSRYERISHVARRTKKADPESAFTIGRAAVSGAGAFGLAALCYYGLGLSNRNGIVEKSILWPTYVKDRIKTTYMYVGGSVLVAVTTAVATFHSPALMRVFASGSILTNLLLCGSLIATSMIVHNLPYSPGFGAKQIGWLTFASLVGGMIAPLSFYGGQALIRAAWYTSGIVGGLSLVAMCAPSEQFLKMGGPLAIGAGLVFVSGIGAMFLPPTTVFGAGLHSMFMYGGLILFSALLLYDTQRITKTAESLPPDHYTGHKYDPINMSMGLFMDIVNIFMRLVYLNSGSKKK